MKYVLRRDLPERLDVLLAEGPQLPIVDVVQILAYIGKGPVSVSAEALREALLRLMPDHVEEIMQGFGKQYFEEGVAVGEARGKVQGRAEGKVEGKAEGKVEGKAEGESRALVRLLEKRLGPVSPTLRARIFAADLASIERWFDCALEATDLDSVFDPN